MQLLTVQDPRDNLEKARRKELELFADANGVKEIQPNMPAMLMRQILRRRGLVNITVPNRPLGHVAGIETAPQAVDPANVVEADAVDDLVKQWQQDQPQNTEISEPDDKPAKKPRRKNPIFDLRKECTARGIAYEKTDKVTDLKAKLDGKNTFADDK